MKFFERVWPLGPLDKVNSRLDFVGDFDLDRGIFSFHLFICQCQAQTNSKYRVAIVAGQQGSELH